MHSNGYTMTCAMIVNEWIKFSSSRLHMAGPTPEAEICSIYTQAHNLYWQLTNKLHEIFGNGVTG